MRLGMYLATRGPLDSIGGHQPMIIRFAFREQATGTTGLPAAA
ncbi:hypothetical protein AB0D08_27580 [Kitasatospora sp. NPDC048540]